MKEYHGVTDTLLFATKEHGNLNILFVSLTCQPSPGKNQ
jgi:hypothetical protein